MGLRKDIWRVGISNVPLDAIIEDGCVRADPVAWLPALKPFQFMADPFGFWKDDILYVFVETFDYRTRHGIIEVFLYDTGFRLLEQRVALSEPWHLSYPFVFEADGAIWMLPEAYHSGKLTLYRAQSFPDVWEPACVIDLGPDVAVDATPFYHDGLWWLFYTPASKPPKPVGELHLAFAEQLHGPWTRHPGNPVRLHSASTRPGGTPRVLRGQVMLPVQDCSWTYGGAIRPLWFEKLTPEHVVTHAGSRIKIPEDFSPYTEGMHTLSAAGAVTVFDVKRTELSAHGLSIELMRETRKILQKLC
ncbi:formyl transferase [Acetobacter persici]|uniref:Formyl transferase n=1 Tax=Acetobacter persici TaxID=1076596 RepID=A0A1U9LBW1_9PROT|nr:formyl transferase [Acetobacter persici]AQT03943.1 formyl transferase [Acetobacter persici]